jgi:hypothetical protein
MAVDTHVALEHATIVALSTAMATFITECDPRCDPDRVLEALVLLARQRAHLLLRERAHA